MKKIICFTINEARDVEKIKDVKALFPGDEVVVVTDASEITNGFIDDAECIILNTDSFYIFDLAHKQEGNKVSFWFDGRFNFQLTNFYFQYEVKYFFIHEKNSADFQKLNLPVELVVIETNKKIGSTNDYDKYELIRKLLTIENERLRKLQ